MKKLLTATLITMMFAGSAVADYQGNVESNTIADYSGQVEANRIANYQSEIDQSVIGSVAG